MRNTATTQGSIARTVVSTGVLLALFGCSRTEPVPPEQGPRKESILLATLPPDVNPKDLQFKADGKEVVYRGTAPDGRQGFAFNGRIEQYYDAVGDYVTYAQDGSHHAYTAKKDGKAFIVVDGTEGERFDQVWDPVMGDSGRPIAYAAKSGGEALIVLKDRRLENKYEVIAPPWVSPDGRRVVYKAKKAGQWLYVIDEIEGPSYDEVVEGYFSQDGRSFAYAGRRGAKWVFVIDGKESSPYDDVGVYPEAADKNFFTAKEGGMEFVVFQGKRGPNYDKVGMPVVSRDGKQIAYIAKKGSKSIVVLGEREGKSYDDVDRLVLSPDGKEIAYQVDDGQQLFMVRNDVELRDYLAMPGAAFSPEGGKLAYVAVTKGASKSFVVEEGKKGKEYDKVGFLAWSADGRHLAYAASQGNNAFLVVDGREGESFDKILSLKPWFSPDGKFVRANALRGKEVWLAVEKVESSGE